MADEPGGLASFALPEKTNIETAEAVVAWANSAASDETCVLDAEATTAIDGATLIAVISAAKTLKETGGGLAVKSPSTAFVDAFTDLGLFEEMMKMEFR